MIKVWCDMCKKEIKDYHFPFYGECDNCKDKKWTIEVLRKYREGTVCRKCKVNTALKKNPGAAPCVVGVCKECVRTAIKNDTLDVNF